MSSPTRQLVVVLTFFLATPVGAADKPSAQPSDARRAALVKAGYTPVPLMLKPGPFFIFVDGTVDSAKTKFFLDSGLPETMIDLKLAKQLKLALGAESETIGLNGNSIVRWTYATGLMIGPYDTRKDWPNVAIQAADLSGWPEGTGGVLGMGALDPRAAVVDYSARTLYLQTTVATAWPLIAGNWTVTSWEEDGAARKLDPKIPPTLTFADSRFKLTDGDQTREYAIRFRPNDTGDYLLLINPKQDGGLPPLKVKGGGRIKVADGIMTLCLLLDPKPDKPRELPTEFASPKGSGYMLLKLKHTAPDIRKQANTLRDLLLKDGYTAVPLVREPDGKRIVIARVGEHDLRLVVDTGTSISAFEAAELGKLKAERLGRVEVERVNVEKVSFRGLRFGNFDTRRTWSKVYGGGVDLTRINRALAEKKRQPIQGGLCNFDLLNGSAVIDFGNNTLYLRPVKETLWPKLEGKWVGARYQFDGREGRFKPGDGAVEFKGGHIWFITKDGTTEWGFHLRDEGNLYRVGLFDPKADELADDFKYSSGGLLKLTGDKMTLVMEQGPIRKEPTEFAAPAGSGLLLVEYERAK
jgi:hypothetical protein